MKGQMILASSLIVLIFVSLIALRLSEVNIPEIRESNSFDEYQRAARASFFYDTGDALYHMSEFSKFAEKRGVFSLYATSRYDGKQVDITLSNFLGDTANNITFYQTLSREYAFAASLEDGKSFIASFQSSSAGPYNITVEYFRDGKKGALSFDSIASQGLGSFKGTVMESGVSKEVRARNY